MNAKESTIIQNGHYFLKILDKETSKIEEEIREFGIYIENEIIPEETRDSILATIGKAKLLICQKFKQFRSLCYKNINSQIEENQFIPSIEDLAGFWDMVYIQVKLIQNSFIELRKLRQNDWKCLESSCITTYSTLPRRGPKKLQIISNNFQPIAPFKSENIKARDEARRLMSLDKKRLLQSQKKIRENVTEIEWSKLLNIDMDLFL